MSDYRRDRLAPGQREPDDAVRAGQVADIDRRLRRVQQDDVEISDPRRLVMQSPNGNRFKVVVANDGTLSTVAVL